METQVKLFANTVIRFLWCALPGINTEAITDAFQPDGKQPELELRRT